MPQTRQLAAIMFTDIVGYTALMGNDDKKAMAILQKNRELQKPIIEEFNGRWIKELGDGVMASFNTASDAVNAAIKIQEACNAANDFQLRIGIHLGEVIFVQKDSFGENDDVFGDGVNIASRIESLGIPGAILMSKAIRDQVRNNSDFILTSLGSFDFKNVSEPVEVFALANAGFVVPKKEEMQGKLKQIQKKSGAMKWIAAAVLIAASAFAIWFLNSPKKSSESDIEKSIAVLSFVDMSPAKDQEYFSDGLSEELLNLLAKIPELKVIGRTSSFSFKGKNEDLRSIAQKLGVAHLLEGSVRKDGNTIRVTAQLIKAKDGSHLWSETYDRDLKDIFKLQDEIAIAVVKQLKIKLLSMPDSLTSSSINTEVYNLILQGNYFLEKRDKENLTKALDFYLQVLAIDSLNAGSWAAVANCYVIQADWGWIDRNEGFEKAEKACRKALALDEKQAEAHVALGLVKMHRFQWDEAEKELQQSLKLKPGNADILRFLGYLYLLLGRFDEAIVLTKQSIALDPIKSIAYFNYGYLLYCANHLEEAIASYKKALELNPGFPSTHFSIGKVFLLQGKPELALDEMQQETEIVSKIAGLALTYHALDRNKEANEIMNKFLLQYQNKWPYMVAELYAFRGDNDNAFGWMEKAYLQKDNWVTWLKADPLLENLWSDPRYNALLKKMNLPLK